ncbi:MAG: alpha/beta hydrolase fold domain-containing protein [Actinomycetaceae bacterium]|nr:alpha/beta hydrolase [Arcanobacterium sp.]MDD7687515.1 alpha/beta hydrolase fold domain-containing protein [Actinomycetaceae bacterium]MDY5272990.1 alpha/beta hydrolase fold domain-containing protein [Arcanobacterium sp.]
MGDVRYTVVGNPTRGTIVAFTDTTFRSSCAGAADTTGAAGTASATSAADSPSIVDRLSAAVGTHWRIVAVENLGVEELGAAADFSPAVSAAASAASTSSLNAPNTAIAERAMHFTIARIDETHDHGVVLFGSGRGAALAAHVARRIPQAVIALILDSAPTAALDAAALFTNASAAITTATDVTDTDTANADITAANRQDKRQGSSPTATSVPSLLSPDPLDSAAISHFLDAVYPESREATPYIDPEILSIIRQAPAPAHITIRQSRERSEHFYRPVQLPDGFHMDIQQLSADTSAISDLADSPDSAAPRSFEMRLIRAEGEIGAILFVVHGGGYVAGTAKGEDIRCVEMIRDFSAYVWPSGVTATQSQPTTVSYAKTFLTITPDYALAPEYPHPAGLHDTLTALRWTFATFPHIPVILYGDSAGSGMIRQVLHHLGEEELAAIAGVIALEPCLSPRMDTASFAGYRNGLSWTKESAENAWEAYGMANADGAAARLVAGGMDSTAAAEQAYGFPIPPLESVGLEEVEPPLTQLSAAFPAILIVINPADTLRDEGIAWFTHLADLGANVQIHSYPGTLHGWLSASGTRTWERVRHDLRPFIADVLAQ